MSDHQFAFLTSTTHPGFLNAPPLAARQGAEVVVAGVAWAIYVPASRPRRPLEHEA